MTAREKILNAFRPEGTDEIGVVSCYDAIFIRDHWPHLTEIPWYYRDSGVVEKELAWARDFALKSGLEWLQVWPCSLPRAKRSSQRYEVCEDGVWRIDEETGDKERLLEPVPGGTNTGSAEDRHVNPDFLPRTQNDVEALIPVAPVFDRDLFLAEGRQDLARAIRDNLDLILYGLIGSPLWTLYYLLGYEGMMIFIAQDPGLAVCAGQRLLGNLTQQIRKFAALGVDAVWIEECLTDQISPRMFRELSVPLVQGCVDEIRACGIKSIYYYCGNPTDRLDFILEAGADAVHFEESKKNYTVDIEEIMGRIGNRATLFGNLDSIGVLQNGAENEVRLQVKRQLQAGRKNGGRFIMSTGSPITPGTSVERVKFYTDIAREHGK